MSISTNSTSSTSAVGIGANNTYPYGRRCLRQYGQRVVYRREKVERWLAKRTFRNTSDL